MVSSKFLPHIGYYHMYGFLFLEYIYIPNLIHLKFLCDYVFTHFTLKSPQLPGGEVYLNGEWTYNRFIPEYRMTYNRETQAYEATALLKQGYYNYNYLFVPDGDTQGNSGRTDGNFYETENEYIILVYHRPNGGRYDKLVGYRRMNFKINGK